MTRRMNRTTLTVVGIALAIICFFAVNLFASAQLGPARLDLTESGIYTLSDGTQALLGEVEEPIRLRLYSSRPLLDAIPGLKPYAAEVREMLDSYVKLSRDRISLEVIDPEPFSPEEDRAAAFGLRGIPYDSTGTRGYFGLVGTNSTDDVSSLPFLGPERAPFLEYDLTRLVYDLAHPEKPVLAVLDGVGMAGGPQSGYRPWILYSQIGQFFDIRLMAGDIDRIADDVKALLVVHPAGLSDKTQFAVDQFVLRGGPTMVFVDPLAEARQRNAQMGMPPEDTASNLDRLMQAWGVKMEANKVVGDAQAAMRVQAQSGGRAVIAQYLPWLDLAQSAVARDDAITSQLEVLRLFSAGALKPAEGATTQLKPLVETSVDSMLIDGEKLQFFPDPVALMREFKPSGERFVVAARVSGPAKTAFPDGPPKAAAEPAEGAAAETAGEAGETKTEPAPLAQSAQPINVIVVADVDMLADDAWLNVQGGGDARLAQPIAHNGDFVINALENLAGGRALANLRGRGLSHRPFTTVERIRTAAEAKYLATEDKLSKELEDAQKKLASLEVEQQGDGTTTLLLTAEQQETVRAFRAQVLDLRAQLREVQHALRRDIERVETWVMLANIAAVPVVVAVLALAVALWRRALRRRPRAAG
jgi:ABC-type uncharacterized transport system involved in gliding motility auxiliary subunit